MCGIWAGKGGEGRAPRFFTVESRRLHYPRIAIGLSGGEASVQIIEAALAFAITMLPVNRAAGASPAEREKPQPKTPVDIFQAANRAHEVKPATP